MDQKQAVEQVLHQRRVVVTGLGLICGVGNTVQEVWEGLLAGRSGMAEIRAFDLTGHPVRFAAEVKDFDPLAFIDKKEARKMGRFIHFAIAAAQEAMDHSCLKIDESNGDRVGVHIGSGIGGFDVIEREHSAMLAGGPRKIAGVDVPGPTRVITYVSRGFESMRGFDLFMRAAKLIYQQYVVLAGFTTVAGLIVFSLGIITMCLGVIGIYLAKIYNQVRGRPIVVIRDLYR